MTPLVRTFQAKTLKVHMISDVCYTPWPVFPADTSEHLSDPQHAPSGPATSSNHDSPHCRAPVYSVMHLLVMPYLMGSSSWVVILHQLLYMRIGMLHPHSSMSCEICWHDCVVSTPRSTLMSLLQLTCYTMHV